MDVQAGNNISTGTSGPRIWLNGHAFAEHILCGGRTLPWEKAIEFAAHYRQLQGILEADRLSVPLVGFLHDWLQRNPQVLQDMTGKKRVRYALKRLLTSAAMRAELTELLTAVCAVVGTEVMLELPSNAALISWAHTQANPGASAGELHELDIDSTSVYLADTVRLLKPAGLRGLVVTVSEPDMRAGATAELYQPLSNVAANYQWYFAFRRPSRAREGVFDAGALPCLGVCDGDCENTAGADFVSLGAEFWQTDAATLQRSARGFYAELPAFAEPEVVRARIALLRRGEGSRS